MLLITKKIDSVSSLNSTNFASMPRILALDYGLKRTGIAVTDNLGLIASPLTTIETLNLIDWLKKYLASETVSNIVLGLPKRLNGTDTHATQPVLELKLKLETEFTHVKIDLIDERYSSKEAAFTIAHSGLGKNKRKDKKLLDTVSATLILQTYLNQQP